MERHEAVAMLLMGAAYADNELDGREVAEVEKLLRRITGESELDSRLAQCLTNFDPGRFDMKEVAAVLAEETDAAKRKILELVVAVHDSDRHWNFDEDRYVRELGDALGVPGADYADLVVDELDVQRAGFVIMPPGLGDDPENA